MKKTLQAASVLFLFINFSLQAQTGGEQIFKTICSACHTVNKGKLVGPDLSGIYKIRNNDWLVKFVKSSQTMVKSGDTAAVNIFNQFNKIPMPDNQLSDEQVLSVIDYIKQQDQSAGKFTAETKPATDVTKAVKTDTSKTADKQQAPSAGEQVFKTICSACHTVNKGKLIGPDLTGIYKIRNNDWLIRFIKSSQTMVKSGDTAAVNIFNQFSKIPMPDNQLSDEQILSLIDYIKQQDQAAGGATAEKKSSADMSKGAADTSKTAAALQDTVSLDETRIQKGKALYTGHAPFSNGAVPCISCHNVNNESVLGGGKLALDLTGAYTKLTAQGIRGILANPPFPAMKAAVKGQLTEDEISSLITFLKAAGEFKNYNRPLPGGLIFFAIAFVCAMFLLVHTYIFYDNREIPDSIPGTAPKDKVKNRT